MSYNDKFKPELSVIKEKRKRSPMKERHKVTLEVVEREFQESKKDIQKLCECKHKKNNSHAFKKLTKKGWVACETCNFVKSSRIS